jgi:hypothetical protein
MIGFMCFSGRRCGSKEGSQGLPGRKQGERGSQKSRIIRRRFWTGLWGGDRQVLVKLSSGTISLFQFYRAAPRLLAVNSYSGVGRRVWRGGSPPRRGPHFAWDRTDRAAQFKFTQPRSAFPLVFQITQCTPLLISR